MSHKSYLAFIRPESQKTRKPESQKAGFPALRLSGFLAVPYALLRLARPLNGLIAAISVVLGAFLAKGGTLDTRYSTSSVQHPVLNTVIVAVAAFLLLSAGNALNDFCDIETDRINKPSRPIPSGQLKPRLALAFALALFAVGTALGLLVNWIAFSVACIVSALLVLYNIILRRLLLISNIVIGLLTGLTFISGGIAVGAVGGAVIPAVFAFLFTAGREVIKDIQDVTGDGMSRLSSLPIRWGRRRAMYVSFIFLAFVILISPWPFFLRMYSLYYLICVVLGVDLVLIYCMFVLLTSLTEQSAAKVARLMKFDIFVGLAAIYLGTL